ncbi:MAG: sigma-54-dependent Fis family transcriptional regulator [Proteobacteria bacterium]|nr:sigma-54-dependent Fis family transcriptional regulator [Pseudomonadota bacterium]
MTTDHILFIEDDSSGREVGIFNLKKAGYIVEGAASGEQGLEQFDANKHALVITDVRMPGITGMDVLAEVKKRAPFVPVLVITAYADVDLAVKAMKAGAFDFIGKPFNKDHLLLTVEKALQSRRLSKEVRDLRIRATGVERPIIYQSSAMEKTLEMADKLAKSDATVLVTGESGTGKELIARRIHVLSPRAEGPFVAVNAAAMPAELLESELFGHEKGAFTGADKPRTGRFRQAGGGTLFLDEVAELPFELQGKLLRVLQERVVDVLGADNPIHVDVRVVAATNRNLTKEIKKGRFREDLYYRINVVEVEVPPLRNRIEDIEPLAKHFITKYADGRELTVSDELLDELQMRPWPGNVRELENACQRAVILATGNQVSAEDLPMRSSDLRGDSDDSLRQILTDEWPSLPKDGLSLIDLERRVIERVLAIKGGNVTQAALYLKIPRHVLAYRMEKYGIPAKG